ncbi:RNA polymerase sigma factor [Desulfopila sp. IMCC35008]|uniref:RNA polymerase sigma factor n=1 Tax=Desulfopila sp. IMCC35008 TaxID=2653858 RepID=UPI0013D8DDFC|nr:RNA polymerase sigma factor [Desulfopila sp. IMCC35008]
MSQKERLFGYLLGRTGDYQLSKDIMQESFVKYIEHYGKAEPIPTLLFTICRNLLVDQSRKQRSEFEFDENLHSHDTGHEEYPFIREESRHVLKAILQLDKEEAYILSLVVGSNLTYNDIAKITKMSEANVKIKVHRSRIKLKELSQRGER